MKLLEELSTEISGYARDSIEVKIERFEPYNEYGDKWDEGDYGSFSVKVMNNGDLDIRNLLLQITGSYGVVRFVSWTQTPMVSGDWAPQIEVSVDHIAANSERYVPAQFSYHALRDTQGTVRELINVQVVECNVNLDNLLRDKTTQGFLIRGSASAQIYDR